MNERIFGDFLVKFYLENIAKIFKNSRGFWSDFLDVFSTFEWNFVNTLENFEVLREKIWIRVILEKLWKSFEETIKNKDFF